MNRYGPTSSPDYPWLMALVVAVCAAGAGSALWPAVEHVVTAVLIGVPLLAAAVWAWRREARIRARLADTAGGPDRAARPGGPPAPTSSSTADGRVSFAADSRGARS